jgi:hypothetical protein
MTTTDHRPRGAGSRQLRRPTRRLSLDSSGGVRIEVKRGTAYISSDEARTLARWLLAAA